MKRSYAHMIILSILLYYISSTRLQRDGFFSAYSSYSSSIVINDNGVKKGNIIQYEDIKQGNDKDFKDKSWSSKGILKDSTWDILETAESNVESENLIIKMNPKHKKIINDDKNIIIPFTGVDGFIKENKDNITLQT